MGLFDQFPYTNFHELNLDWILKALKELEHTIEQFVAINALKYADPIQWNIVSQYEKNTIVIDPQTGTAYISVQPVPSGVALTNEDYWTVVFDLGRFVVRASKNFANTYEAETTLTATVSTAAGGWLVWGDTLYKALVNITAGDSYVVGGNIAHFTMEDIIGHLEDLTTTDKSNLVAAINDAISEINAEAAARTLADTALQSAIDDEAQAREAAIDGVNNKIGDLADLKTTDKSSVVGAINEALKSGTVYNVLDFGAVGDGTTDDTAAITSAITEAYNNGGGIVFFPATGAAYLISSITVPSGVTLLGTMGNNYEGMDASLETWTRKGSWIHPTSTTNEGVKLTGHGSGMIGLNIIYSQPEPTSGWTPTQYPFAILCTANHVTINQVFIIAASHGLNMEYTSTSGGCTDTSITNLYVSTFNVGIQLKNLNDTIQMNNIQIRGLWNHLDSNVVNYINNNLIGMDIYYCDNIVMDGVHIFDAHMGFNLHNSTCLGNTHSLFNCMISNIQFNLCQYAMYCDNDAIAQGSFVNVLAQVLGSYTGHYLFDLPSTDTKFSFSNLYCPYSYGFFKVHGDIKVVNAIIHYGPGGMPCVDMENGTFEIRNQTYVKETGAGVIVAGAYAYTGYISNNKVFPYWMNISTDTRTGSSNDVTTTEFQYRPLEDGMAQIRMLVHVNIESFNAGDVMRIYLNNIRETLIEHTITATGLLTFDSGWIDITSGPICGSLVVESNTTVEWKPYAAQVSFRA